VPHTHASRRAYAPRRGHASPCGHARGPARRAAAVLALAVAAGPLAVVLLPVGPVAPQPALAQETARQQSPAQPSVFIESVSPQWAQPGRAVTETGIVRNGTSAPAGGLSIQLRSSASPLGDRDDLTLYADGDLPVDQPVGLPVTLPSVIAPGQTVRWQATLNPSDVGMSVFGVYPLAAQILTITGAPEATDRTFLPFWPGGSPAQLPKRLSIAWVWPILSRPYEGVCRALLSGGLAGGLATGGRLNGLLAAGSAYSARAGLTWAIDPALVQAAQTMSHPYAVGGGPDCTGATPRPADQAARTWLRDLIGAVSGQRVFLTPYADVDVDALSHVGLDADLRDAFAEGRSAGGQILHVPAGADTIAWPPSGLADSGILDSLAINGIGTVVLSSSVMPPSGQLPSYTPSAQTTAASGLGSSLHVLLADQTISQILAAPTGPAVSPGSSFATEQSFLAQTAMIVAERPATARSLVVTPPRLWDPAPGEAGSLLSETVNAPWLQPTTLANLAAQAHPAGQVARQAPPAHYVSPYELPPAYLGQVASLDAAVRLQASIFVPPDPGYLNTTVAALESADWPGSRAQAAAARSALLTRALGYIASQSQKVTIIDSDRITLGGSSGRVPVSISNGLNSTVEVQLHASVSGDGRLSIGPFDGLVRIPAGKTTTIRLPVQAPTVGLTDVTLSLLSPDGSPLPGTTVHLPVHATRFGTFALVIMCVALGVFVLTSSARAFRRSRRDGGQHTDGENGGEVSDPPGPAAVTGSVRAGDDLANDHPPEDPDEYADARGRARR
jgi:hypothetical protein